MRNAAQFLVALKDVVRGRGGLFINTNTDLFSVPSVTQWPRLVLHLFLNNVNMNAIVGPK